MTATIAALTALVCLTGQAQVPADMQSGTAKFYSAKYGNWQRIADKRGVSLCPGCDGYGARIDCGTIGSVFYARIAGRTYKLTQVDCSDPTKKYKVCNKKTGKCWLESDADRHRRTGLIVEVPYWIAVETGISKRGRGPALTWEAR